MTYAITPTNNHPRLSERFSHVVASLGTKRASRGGRVQTRRTVLAMSETALIQAHIRYRRIRYRHMAS